MSQSSLITQTIVLFHRSYLKFHRNVKIPWQRANSAAWLEILRPAENCGP